MRYLSPPLFPVRLRDLSCKLFLHEVPCGDFEVGEFCISSSLVCHPGPTVGYRIATSHAVLAYLPDHEPALGLQGTFANGEWTSGYSVAVGVDLLIHDAQYTIDEYVDRIGWGHSSLQHALEFAALAGVKEFMPFHYDPTHSDADLDRLIAEAVAMAKPAFQVTPATEGATFELGSTRTQTLLCHTGSISSTRS
jgi:hypothetical protein